LVEPQILSRLNIKNKLAGGTRYKFWRNSKNELQSTLPQTTSVTSPFADVVFSSTLVAISRDEGKNWYFYDTNAGKLGQLKNKAPDISPELEIPKPTPPKITPKQQQ